MLPQQGDYERRHTTLVSLFRPPDVVSWDVLRAEMRAGVARVVPEWAGTGYSLLWAYAREQGVVIGEADDCATAGHPLLYLHSALRIQHGVGRWPPLVRLAFEEFKHETVSHVFSRPKGWAPIEDRGSSGRPSDRPAAEIGGHSGRRGSLRLEF